MPRATGSRLNIAFRNAQNRLKRYQPDV